MSKKSRSMTGMQPALTFIIIVLMIFGSLGILLPSFPKKSSVGGVSFPTNSILPNDPIIKAWEYGMIVFFTEIPDLKFPFFLRLTKFQQCMFKRIHRMLTSPEGSMKVPFSRSLYVEVHCALIEYKNEKAKPAYYLVQISDVDDPNDQRQEWFPDRCEIIFDPALARAAGF